MKKRYNKQSIKTENLLKKVFLEELSNKNIEKITVSSLCLQSDIDRSTFYLHYKDVYDLLEQIENDFYRKALLQAEQIKNGGMNDMDIMKNLLEFIYDNRTFLKLLINEPHSVSLWYKINELVSDLFEYKVLEQFIIPDNVTRKQFDDTIRFLTFGYYSIYSKWISEDCKESLEYISKYSSEISFACLENILIKK